MLKTIKKSKQLFAIALNRLHDYKELARIEMKLQGRSVGVQVAAYVLAAILAVMAILFIGAAIIVTAWDSDYRTLAAWLVVLLYGGLAAGCLMFVKHYHGESTLTTLRSELRRDMDTLKESL
ncbi:MAG: phage holin family protein [Burkholderiales bacterium]|nr:phage holin family protein [Burkholderiales bacterium]